MCRYLSIKHSVAVVERSLHAIHQINIRPFISPLHPLVTKAQQDRETDIQGHIASRPLATLADSVARVKMGKLWSPFIRGLYNMDRIWSVVILGPETFGLW